MIKQGKIGEINYSQAWTVIEIRLCLQAERSQKGINIWSNNTLKPLKFGNRPGKLNETFNEMCMSHLQLRSFK